jgi:hypothetical protein
MVSAWAETCVGAEMQRAGIEKGSHAQIEVAVECFGVDPSKPELVLEHADA